MSSRSNPVLNAYFGHLISKKLLEEDISIRALADRVGVSNATIADIKNGKRSVGLEALEALTRYFSMTFEEAKTRAKQWADETGFHDPEPPQRVVDLDPDAGPEFRNIRGWNESVAAHMAAFGRPKNDYTEAGSLKGLHRPERMTVQILQRLIDLVVAIREADIDPEQKKIIAQMDAEDAMADAKYEEQQKANRETEEAEKKASETPKPSSSKKKKP